MKKRGFDKKRLPKRSANLGDMDFGTRMKRVIACFCVLLTAPGLAACGKGAQVPQPEPSAALQTTLELPTEIPDDDTLDTSNMKKQSTILVAYFSASGTTEKIAQYAADILEADIYEIVPETPYTQEDLDYNNSSSRANREQSDPSARPAISGEVGDMQNYDTVFLAYPIWHGQAPRIISTFLESYDFSGKTIVPFCTSHSSGIGSSDTNLHSLCPDTAAWRPGERFPAGTTKESVKEWIDNLDISAENTVGSFDFETKTVLLNSGYEMPIMGLGTYSLSDEECARSVSALLEAGGRLIDTAYMYHNEAAVGKAIRESGVPRDEIFVITKLYPNQFANAAEAIDEALQRMGLT